MVGQQPGADGEGGGQRGGAGGGSAGAEDDVDGGAEAPEGARGPRRVRRGLRARARTEDDQAVGAGLGEGVEGGGTALPQGGQFGGGPGRDLRLEQGRAGADGGGGKHARSLTPGPGSRPRGRAGRRVARPGGVSGQQAEQPPAGAGWGAGAPMVGRPSMTPGAGAGAALRRAQASPARVRRTASGVPSASRWCGAA